MGEPVEESPISTWTGGSALAAGGATVCLYTLLVCGPIALVMVFLVGMSPATVAPVTSAAQSSESTSQETAASGLAGRFVQTWLETTRDDTTQLDQYVPDASTGDFPAAAWDVTDVATVGAVQVRPSVWSVTVAATITPADGGRAAVSGLRYFTVPVSAAAGRVSVLAWPAAAPGPAVVPAQDLSSTYSIQLDATNPVAVSVQQFLTAWLTGSGDVTRFLSPGTAVRPLGGTPYSQVVVSQVLATVDVDPTLRPTDGRRVHVLVTSTADATARQQVNFQYFLTMAARAGRWEVAAIDPAPGIADSTTTTTP